MESAARSSRIRWNRCSGRVDQTFPKRTSTGTEPVRERLKALDEAAHRIIGEDIATAKFRWSVSMPVCSSLGKGLREIRNDISDRRITWVISVSRTEKWFYSAGSSKNDAENPEGGSGSGIETKDKVST